MQLPCLSIKTIWKFSKNGILKFIFVCQTRKIVFLNKQILSENPKKDIW